MLFLHPMNPTIPNCFYRISIKALILDETRTKFLVVQEDSGKWELPGGGLDWGESAPECMRRELMEEMGLEAVTIASQPSYFLTQQKKDADIWIANVLFEVVVENLNFTPSDECVAFLFVNSEEAKNLGVFPNVQMLADMFDPKNHVAE